LGGVTHGVLVLVRGLVDIFCRCVR
jgi:hypothetical protein